MIDFNSIANTEGLLTPEQLSNTLSNYVTNTALNNKGYASQSSLNSALSRISALESKGSGISLVSFSCEYSEINSKFTFTSGNSTSSSSRTMYSQQTYTVPKVFEFYNFFINFTSGSSAQKFILRDIQNSTMNIIYSNSGNQATSGWNFSGLEKDGTYAGRLKLQAFSAIGAFNSNFRLVCVGLVV